MESLLVENDELRYAATVAKAEATDHEYIIARNNKYARRSQQALYVEIALLKCNNAGCNIQIDALQRANLTLQNQYFGAKGE